jgi:hypothetical protein
MTGAVLTPAGWGVVERKKSNQGSGVTPTPPKPDHSNDNDDAIQGCTHTLRMGKYGRRNKAREEV